MIILSVLLGFFATSIPGVGGIVGFLNSTYFLQDYVGKTGEHYSFFPSGIVYITFSN
jgi:S-DNA-T family DNA segregation ATPase FtsK/SpoIIIE